MLRLTAALLVAALASVSTATFAAGSLPAVERVVAAEIAKGFSGVVLVASRDKTLFAKASGKVKGVPVKLNSRFWISSTGKQFVSAAIFKLQDQGRLSVDDPLPKWLPNVPADKQGITVRHLLTHMSGLPQGYVGEGARDNSAAVQGILALDLAGAPGSRFIYSNENYYLAAAILERIVQQDYRHFLQVWILDPLLMTNSGVARGRAGVLPTVGETPKRLTAARWGIGGHYSSAPDLVRWFRALQEGKVLTPVALQEMWKPAAKVGEGEAAAGWFITTTEGGTKRIWTRGNDDYGANSLIYAYPDRDLIIVVLTHSGDKPGGSSWSRSVVANIESALEL